jgi:hypothetical protein
VVPAVPSSVLRHPIDSPSDSPLSRRRRTPVRGSASDRTECWVSRCASTYTPHPSGVYLMSFRKIMSYQPTSSGVRQSSGPTCSAAPGLEQQGGSSAAGRLAPRAVSRVSWLPARGRSPHHDRAACAWLTTSTSPSWLFAESLAVRGHADATLELQVHATAALAALTVALSAWVQSDGTEHLPTLSDRAFHTLRQRPVRQQPPDQ